MYTHSSPYQLLKLDILGFVHLSKDAIHIYIGVGLLLVTTIFLRRSLANFRLLLPVLLYAIISEALDLRDDHATFGYYRWSASIHDGISDLLIPFVLVALTKAGFLVSEKKKEKEQKDLF